MPKLYAETKYMLEKLECDTCLKKVKRKDLHWINNGCNYTNTCEICYIELPKTKQKRVDKGYGKS